MKTFKTAQEFYDFCSERRACESGLAEIKGLTISEWWEKTKHGSYMLWLRKEAVWKLTPVQQAKYNRLEAVAWEEYDRVEVAALEEYDRVTEYKRVTVAALEEYDRVTANAIRSIVGNPWRSEPSK